ncbi:MAG: tetratricopeptide repeat protein [Bacteroidota bacterium]
MDKQLAQGCELNPMFSRDSDLSPFSVRNKLVTISLLALFLILTTAVVFWVLSRPSMRHASTDIPDLPDMTGQPNVLVEYLQRMNRQASGSPSSSEAIGALALAYQSNFFYDEARACLNRATELNTREWRWIYYSALIDGELGDTKATIEKLNRVLVIDSDVTHAWFRLGNCYLKTNSYQEAEKAFQRVLTLKEFLPQRRAGVGLSDTGAYPLKAYATYGLARTEFLQNKLKDARALLEKLIEEYPTFGSAFRLLGDVLKNSGEYQKGAECDLRAGDFESYVPPADPLEDEMILSSRNTAFLIKQFDISAKSKSYDWTLALMNRLITLNPNDGEILTKWIKLALDMQMLPTVDSLLPSFYGICGSDEMKLIDMAKYFVYRGHFEPAVMLLRKAIQLNSKSTDAHLLFIDILAEFKQYEMGISYCKEIISMAPQNADVRMKLARLYVEQGDTRDARSQLEIAQKLSPNDEARFTMLGKIARKEGSVGRALEYYRKALNTNPRNVNIQLEVGNYLVDLRRWSEALKLFQNSLAALPHDIDLNERYAWTLAVCPIGGLHDGEKALKLAKVLSLRRKYTKDQEMRCGITLAAAYARTGQFERAEKVVNHYMVFAKTTKKSSYLHRLEAMATSVRNRNPYSL